MNYFVTGGAGFIGSHIVDHLIDMGHNVTVYDNFSTGKELFIRRHFENSHFSLIKGELDDLKLLNKSMRKSDFVFHLAAHADVRSGFEDHEIDHEQNLIMTKNVLEAMFLNNVKSIVFSSTSSVYGDATVHPTPEDYPFRPTSLYGATKAACESYIQAYASYYGTKTFIFRFVSFVGERYTHGIIFNIMKMLKESPKTILLFSDGTPRKSSVHVRDGIDAIFTAVEKCHEQINVFNIGQDYFLTVEEIANEILNSADHSEVKIEWLGKKSNWKGDNEFVLLDSTKLKQLGWKPKLSFKEGINRTVEYLQKNPELLK